MKTHEPALNIPQMEDYLLEVFPQLYVEGGQQYFVESLDFEKTIVRLKYHDRHLRPGGTFSGP